VTQIPLRNPAMFARQALTLDHVSGGRLEIGLGTGLVGDRSYPMIGVPDWEPKERVARFGEYLEIVDRLLRDETTTFEGSYYCVDGATMQPRPLQSPRPPITVGALGQVMMRHVARRADTWSTMSFDASFDTQVDETRERCARLDEACAEVVRGHGRSHPRTRDGRARPVLPARRAPAPDLRTHRDGRPAPTPARLSRLQGLTVDASVVDASGQAMGLARDVEPPVRHGLIAPEPSAGMDVRRFGRWPSP